MVQLCLRACAFKANKRSSISSSEYSCPSISADKFCNAAITSSISAFTACIALLAKAPSSPSLSKALQTLPATCSISPMPFSASLKFSIICERRIRRSRSEDSLSSSPISGESLSKSSNDFRKYSSSSRALSRALCIASNLFCASFHCVHAFRVCIKALSCPAYSSSKPRCVTAFNKFCVSNCP